MKYIRTIYTSNAQTTVYAVRILNNTLESGEKHPSTGIPLLFRCPANV